MLDKMVIYLSRMFILKMKLQALILTIISFFIFTYESKIIGHSILISITLFFLAC